MRIKKILTDKQLFTESVPRLYGLAYRDYARRASAFYPIPLNWLVRWVRDLRFILSDASNKKSELEKTYRAGFEAGIERGKSQGEFIGRQRGKEEAFREIEANINREFGRK